MVDEKSPSPADKECGSGVDGSNPEACSPLTVGDEKSPSPGVSAHCSGKSAADVEEEDGFYQKLNQINKSSGLSLLFNFRDTSIDLHEFYKLVKDRGGYHSVSDILFNATLSNRRSDDVLFTTRANQNTMVDDV